MTFDSHSLERLQALGRKLPKELAKPNVLSKNDVKKSSELHPIETETDPKLLFKELIQASPDGNIPSHLMTRLKELETSQYSRINNQSTNTPLQNTKDLSRQKNKQESEEEILYASFERLLLENED